MTAAFHRAAVDSHELLYAVVRFEQAASRRVSEVVVTFESAAAADQFATDHRIDDYTVATMSFAVDP